MRPWILTLSLITVLFSSPPVSATVPADAARFIEGLGQRAVALFDQSDQPAEAKEEQVRRLLAENFDLDKIGQFVVGRYWQTMSPDQRASYLRLFREFVLRSYAHNLGGYSGTNFVSSAAGRRARTTSLF
jgi:phospholipid transport system substrate-binding protein